VKAIYPYLITACAVVLLIASFLHPRGISRALAERENRPINFAFETNSKPISPQAKIFLIAGSSQNANFAQEIIDQRRMWLGKGFREEEIVCYYVLPYQDEFERDNLQFVSLIRELRNCYPANAKGIREHLTLVGKSEPRPEFLYLYMTSHGQRPVSLRLEKIEDFPQSKKFSKLSREAQYPVLDNYQLTIEAVSQGKTSAENLLKAYQKGTNPRDLYFTPGYLREILRDFFFDVPKFIVLQGCFTGGFIEDPREFFNLKVLPTLSQITVLTASRYDRESFGCSSGEETTYFGGTYNQVFNTHLSHPLSMDWKKIFEEVREKISILEEEEDKLRPSLPRFFSNFSPS